MIAWVWLLFTEKHNLWKLWEEPKFKEKWTHDKFPEKGIYWCFEPSPGAPAWPSLAAAGGAGR